jgi:hypothetical protein
MDVIFASHGNPNVFTVSSIVSEDHLPEVVPRK